MSFRSIVDLRYAALCLRPPHIPKSRPRGSKALGLRYEKALAAAIPKATHGQWVEFFDANGPGHCQMDLLLVGAKRVVVIEAKLTNVSLGRAQIEQLYFPVVRQIWPEKPPLGIVAARHLSKEGNLEMVCTTLREAIERAESEKIIPTLHWLERTPL